MYACFIQPGLPNPERDQIASAIAKVALSYRLESQVFNCEDIDQDIIKAYSSKARTFVAFGDSVWLDTILTHSIQKLPDGIKLPALCGLPLPSKIIISNLQDQWSKYKLRQSMSILAARRLHQRPIYRCNDQYFLDHMTIRSSDDTSINFHLQLHLVNEGKLDCKFSASEINLQAYAHADHDQINLLYVTAYKPGLQGSDRLKASKTMDFMPGKITTALKESQFRAPIKNGLITTTSDITANGSKVIGTIRAASVSQQITVIEAKNTQHNH